MKRLKVASVQMVSKNNDYEGNVSRALVLIEEAVKKGAKLILLPEVALIGYIFDDSLWTMAEPLKGKTFTWLKGLCKAHDVFIGTCILEKSGEDFYDTFILVGPGEHDFWSHRKIEPASYEAYFFAGGGLNPNVFDTPIGRVGVSICFDSSKTHTLSSLIDGMPEILLNTYSCPWLPWFILPGHRKNWVDVYEKTACHLYRHPAGAVGHLQQDRQFRVAGSRHAPAEGECRVCRPLGHCGQERTRPFIIEARTGRPRGRGGTRPHRRPPHKQRKAPQGSLASAVHLSDKGADGILLPLGEDPVQIQHKAKGGSQGLTGPSGTRTYQKSVSACRDLCAISIPGPALPSMGDCAAGRAPRCLCRCGRVDGKDHRPWAFCSRIPTGSFVPLPPRGCIQWCMPWMCLRSLQR